jgi:hypothetical protein
MVNEVSSVTLCRIKPSTKERNTNRTTTTSAAEVHQFPSENIFLNFKEILKTFDDGRIDRNT